VTFFRNEKGANTPGNEPREFLSIFLLRNNWEFKTQCTGTLYWLTAIFLHLYIPPHQLNSVFPFNTTAKLTTALLLFHELYYINMICNLLFAFNSITCTNTFVLVSMGFHHNVNILSIKYSITLILYTD